RPGMAAARARPRCARAQRDRGDGAAARRRGARVHHGGQRPRRRQTARQGPRRRRRAHASGVEHRGRPAPPTRTARGEWTVMSDGPFIVPTARRVFPEAAPPAAEAARHELAIFAALERAPEHIPTYRITRLGLWNARAAGHEADDMLATLER